MRSKQRWFRAEASTRSFAIVISAYSSIYGHNIHLYGGIEIVVLVTQSQAESQGAGPCNIGAISIRRPVELRSRTSPRRRQKLRHSFLWNSCSVWAQGHPECDRDVWIGDVCLRPPRCFACGLEHKGPTCQGV